MTIHRPRNWPDGQAVNTPSSAASFGFDVVSEIAKWQATRNEVARLEAGRAAHPTARAVRADLIALPPEGEQVGASADRRRHDDRSRPTTAAAVVGAASNPHSAGVRRGLIALACCFAVGWLLGHHAA